MTNDPSVMVPYGGEGARRFLCLEAHEVVPLLFASASSEAQRVAVAVELGLGEAGGELVPLADYFQLTRAHAAILLEESLGLAQPPLVSGATDFVKHIPFDPDFPG